MKKLLVPALAALGLCAALPSFAAGTQAQTKNPIVLVPGIFAFDTLAGVDYWHQIPSALQNQGAKVYVPKINAFDSSAKRGEALISQLEQIRAASGGSVKKFNLIGHSQGGITARYVMNTRPDLVASVTTLHTPHKGSPLADVATGVAPAGTLRGVAFDVFANAVGDLVNLLSNNKKSQADIRAMLAEFNKNGAAANNTKFPTGIPTSACGEGPETATIAGNSVRMYSWSGTWQLTNVLDVSDPLFNTTALAISEANDGVTGRCSSHFGKVIKDNYIMNHLDANNQVLGLVSLFETNPKTLYTNQANRLKNLGL
ncbi:lipase family alpha/beta hydrolase [Aquipseudomonas ullengensis]|uniref:Triacylglycerol lipase n=1 Tax=Aquipseudomonas ullengensis TaxID=2759166 RepID=A0A7W4QC70_9GAMM|nr:triacylglycerol lipase [Pseudomonas ullengensis]MBB2497220.1 triacylglycerol lipase [Pseudomonas ullengensis]